MSGYLLSRDVPIWLAAKPWLDVRTNDEHTLISYRIGQALLNLTPQAEESIVLPAIILHDVGWKKLPEDKLTQAVGPYAKFPELVRIHEVEGAKIARETLENLAITGLNIDHIADIIDGHDTRPTAISPEDALMKDADKLWRFTRHGRTKLAEWFDRPAETIYEVLRDTVMPQILSDAGRAAGETLLAQIESELQLNDLMALEANA